MSTVGSIFFFNEFILDAFEIMDYFENSVNVVCSLLEAHTRIHVQTPPGVQVQGAVGHLGSTKVKSLHLNTASRILA